MSSGEKGPGGGGNKIYNWGNIRRDIEDETPQEMDFKDVYPEEEILRDTEKVRKYKEKKGIKVERGVTDSQVQEYATAQEIGEMDWFGEDLRDHLFANGQGCQTAIFLSSEFDDYINHIDAIGVMNNAESDFQTMPFALDMTYNTDLSDLSDKMGHTYPFEGAKIPGLATAKYFEDTFHQDPLLDKGKIDIMPRFVVGFSTELSKEITELRMGSSWGSLRRDELSTKAKWCVLRELKMQSEQLLGYLEKHHTESERLETAYTQVKALDKFFDGAIEVAAKNDKPEWMGYPDNDDVFRAIEDAVMIRSNE